MEVRSSRGVTVRNGGRSLDRDAGVNGVVVERNVVGGDEALEEARRGNGIHLFNSVGSRIIRNHVCGTRDGIYFSFVSGSDVEGNVVTRVRYGLH